MNVTWLISYSGRTPEKSWFADRALQFFHDATVSLNSTAMEKAVQHDSLELARAFWVLKPEIGGKVLTGSC